jgi:hypothetical protein
MAKDIVRSAAPEAVKKVESTPPINYAFPVFPLVGIMAILALYAIKK